MNRTPFNLLTVDMYTYMDMQNVRNYGKGNCRSPRPVPEIQFRGLKGGRDELHVSHDPSFPEQRLRTTCFIISDIYF
jgi:hypothetical protein